MKTVRTFQKKKDVGTQYESIQAFLDDQKVTYKVTDDHYQANCFICDETRNRLGIVKDGQPDAGKWHCFNCSGRGTTLKTLIYAYNNKGKVNQKKIRAESPAKKKSKSTIEVEAHIKFHKVAVNKKKSKLAWNYLTKERKINPEAIEHFKLGSRSVFPSAISGEKEIFEHIAIPYLVDGKCVNLKYRSLDPDVDKKFKWRREKGGETALFNHDILYDLDYNELFIVESELDCVSMWCLGFKNVVGMTAGADAFQDLWYEQLQRYEKFYLVLDRDEAGQEGAHKIAKRLGLDKCYNIVLPEDVKDPNDFLLKYKHEDFLTVIKGATQFEVPNVVSLGGALDTLVNQLQHGNNENMVGFDTPWKSVNDKLGPVRPGHFVILAARPKVGKSTLALNWMRYLASKNVSVGMYSCEMKVTDIGWRMAQMEVPTLPSIQSDAKLIDLKEARVKLPGNKLHFYYPQIGDLDLEKVEEKIREMVQRYGIKVFIFDNLHFLCRGEDEKAMLDKTTQVFKILAENLAIVIVAVTHPRKGSDGKNISNDDLKGSSSIFQDADAVLLLNRRLEIDDDVNDEQAELALAKTMIQVTARFSSGGRAILAFNGSQGKFTDKGFLYTKVRNFMKETTSRDKKKKQKK